jgi:hypothetical protein
MPITPEGVYYADNSTEMSVADITSAMATSISEQIAILREGGIVSSDAERDDLYPVPVQGNTVFRDDLGLRQTYYALYNATTNPGGKATAGWLNETRIFVQSGTPSSPYTGDLWFW